MKCAGSTGSVVGASNSPGILRGSPYTSSATDTYRSSLNDNADSEENQGKRICPMLVCVAHDGCLQCPLAAGWWAVVRES
jgi:hypothetical protein